MGTNRVEDPDLFFGNLQQLIRKSKWSAKDLQMLNRMVDHRMGYALHNLFSAANQPLFDRYYPNICPRVPMTNERLVEISEQLQSGKITLDQFRVRKIDLADFVETKEQRLQRQVAEKSLTNDTSVKCLTTSNKSNSCKVKCTFSQRLHVKSKCLNESKYRSTKNISHYCTHSENAAYADKLFHSWLSNHLIR